MIAIGEKAFANNEDLTGIIIPAGVTEIGDNAFFYCVKLESVSLPESLTYLGEGAFYKCKSLKEANLPGGIKTVRYQTFSYAGIERLVLSDGITALDELAIDYCDYLSCLVLPSTLEIMATDAVYACDSLTEVEVPASLRTVGGNPFSCCMNLGRITVAPDNPYFEVVDGILYGIEDRSLACYPCALPGTEAVVRDGTEVIHQAAFSWATNIKTVTMPEGLLSIGNYAFQGCLNLETANVPSSVVEIGRLVFYNCPLLTLTVEEGSYAARYCAFESIPYAVRQ